MSNPASPSPLSGADAVRILRLERELAISKSSYDTVLDDLEKSEAKNLRLQADMQRMSADSLRALSEARGLQSNTNSRGGSGNEAGGERVKQLQAELEKTITSRDAAVQASNQAIEENRKLRERNAMLEEYKNRVESQTRLLESDLMQVIKDRSPSKYGSDLLAKLNLGRIPGPSNFAPSTTRTNPQIAGKGAQSSRGFKAPDAATGSTSKGKSTVSGAKSTSTTMPKVEADKKLAASLENPADEGFITPAKGKTASAYGAAPKLPFEAQNASKNSFAALDDPQTPVTQSSPPNKPTASQQASVAVSSSQTANSSDGTGGGTNTGPQLDQKSASGSGSGPRGQKGQPNLPQAGKEQGSTKSHAPSPAPAAVKTSMPAPASSQSKTTPTAKPVEAADDLKEPEISAVPIKKTLKTTAQVLASPPPPKPKPLYLNFLWDTVVEHAPCTDQEPKSKLAANVALNRRAEAQGIVEPASSTKATNVTVRPASPKQETQSNAESTSQEAQGKVEPTAPQHRIHGVQGDPMNKQIPISKDHLDKMTDEIFGPIPGGKWGDTCDDDEVEKAASQAGSTRSIVENEAEEGVKIPSDLKCEEVGERDTINAGHDTPIVETPGDATGSHTAVNSRSGDSLLASTPDVGQADDSGPHVTRDQGKVEGNKEETSYAVGSREEAGALTEVAGSPVERKPEDTDPSSSLEEVSRKDVSSVTDQAKVSNTDTKHEPSTESPRPTEPDRAAAPPTEPVSNSSLPTGTETVYKGKKDFEEEPKYQPGPNTQKSTGHGKKKQGRAGRNRQGGIEAGKSGP